MKKGFTLVEIIISILLLALVVVIIIPNIVKLYNKARLKAFIDESQNIYNSVALSYQSDFLSETKKVSRYCDSKNTYGNKLKIDKNNNLYYDIELDEDGNIYKFYVVKGNYVFLLSGNDINVSDVNEDNVFSDVAYDIDCNGNSGIYCNILNFPCIAVPKFEYTNDGTNSNA